jgi:hypothetical protein
MASWGGNHVQHAVHLRAAVRCVAFSSKPMAARLERAFGWLTGLLFHRDNMPPKQVERLDFIFN